jgi:thioredoxin 1
VGRVGGTISPRRGWANGAARRAEHNAREWTMAGMQHVTDADFASEIEKHEGLAMVDFWATWCGPCQIIAPFVEQLAAEYAGRLKVAKLDVDASPRTPARFNVRSIPSVLFFKDGALVDTVVGAVPKSQLTAKIEKHLG